MNELPYDCSACGIRFGDEAPWTVGGLRAVSCPVCGGTVVVPAPPEEPAEAPVGPSNRGSEASTRLGEPETRERTPDEWLADSQTAGQRVVLACLSIFVVACGLPAVSMFGGGYLLGWQCLVFGWVGCYLWFPNPLLLAGSIALLCGRNRLALTLGVLACTCSLQMFLAVVGGSLRTSVSWGYYLWQADVFLFTATAAVMTVAFGASPGWSPAPEEPLLPSASPAALKERPSRPSAPPTPLAPKRPTVINYRPCPSRFEPRLDPLPPVEQLRCWAVLIAVIVYGVACFLPPVVGYERPLRPGLSQFLYGRGGEWLWVGNPLLLATCLYLMEGRHRTALLLAAATTGVDLVVHLRCAGWQVSLLGPGYFVWQASVLAVRTGAALAWSIFGACVPPPDQRDRS